MIGVGVAAEGVARVEVVTRDAEREVKVVGSHPLAQVGGAEVLALLAEGVRKVEVVDSQLVGHGHVGVVRDAARDPVVAAHGLEPPDLVCVGERDSVHFIGPVAFEQIAEAKRTVTGALGEGKHERDHVLLADSAETLGLKARLALRAARGAVLHERVGGEHALVGGEGLGRAHADVARVEAGGLPETLAQVGVGHGGVAGPALGKCDLQV